MSQAFLSNDGLSVDRPLTRNGTQGRVYGGDCNLVHIADGKRKKMGELLADVLSLAMRHAAREARRNADGPLCPGCTMIALFNAALITAERNGQSRTELAATMRNAFDRLLTDPDAGLTEEIEVLLDPQEP